MKLRAARTLVALAAAGATATAACGLGDKQLHADRIAAAREAAIEAKGAVGAVTFTIEPGEDDRPQAAEGAGALTGGAALPRSFSVEMTVAYDFTTESVQATVIPPPDPLAALAAAAGGQPADTPAEQGVDPAAPAEAAPAVEGPTTLFHAGTTFVRRTNVRPTERRLWAKLDFGRLDDDENPPAVEETPGAAIAIAAATTINPVYLLDLVEGVLAGSLEEAGTETVHGVETTKYEANISIDKAFSDLDLEDDELEVRQLMFRLLRVYDDVRPATFWLDAQGRLRRATYELRQRIDRNDSNEMTITLDFTEYAPAAEVARPAAEETIELQRFGRLIRSALPVAAA